MLILIFVWVFVLFCLFILFEFNVQWLIIVLSFLHIFFFSFFRRFCFKRLICYNYVWYGLILYRAIRFKRIFCVGCFENQTEQTVLRCITLHRHFNLCGCVNGFASILRLWFHLCISLCSPICYSLFFFLVSFDFNWRIFGATTSVIR